MTGNSEIISAVAVLIAFAALISGRDHKTVNCGDWRTPEIQRADYCRGAGK